LHASILKVLQIVDNLIISGNHVLSWFSVVPYAVKPL